MRLYEEELGEQINENEAREIAYRLVGIYSLLATGAFNSREAVYVT